MENSEQTERIIYMMEIYEKGCKAVEEVLSALEKYSELENQIKELEDYYFGNTWLKDFDDDNNEKIPKELNREILTEDAVYDLATDRYRMIKIMKKLVESSESGENNE